MPPANYGNGRSFHHPSVGQDDLSAPSEKEEEGVIQVIPFLGEAVAGNWSVETNCAPDCDGEVSSGCTVVEDWHLPYNCNDIGAEVVVVPVDADLSLQETTTYVELSRRCSYEEVVHEDDQDIVDLSNSSPSGTLDNVLLHNCLMTLTQWALTLQDVYEDRVKSGTLNLRVQKCACYLTKEVHHHLDSLKESLHNFLKSENSKKSSRDLKEKQEKALSSLRSHVTIQVSHKSKSTLT